MKNVLKSGFVVGAVLLGVALASCDEVDSGLVYANENAKNIAVVKLGTHTSLNEIEDNIKATLSSLDGYNINYYDCNFQSDLIAQTLQSLDKSNLACVVCIATPTAVMASNMFDDIPVVFSAVSDPESSGVIGNNVTGTSDMIVLDKLVNLALEVDSSTKRIGYIYTSTEANSISNKNKLTDICKDNNLSLIAKSINNAAEITETFNSMKDDVDCFIVSDDNNVASGMDNFSNLCAKNNIKMYCAADSEIKDGGMMGYSINYSSLGVYTANQVIDIVKNKKAVSEIDVKYFDSSELSLYYNSMFLSSASKVSIPQYLLDNAIDLYEDVR